MATRKIKDAKDLTTNELIYFKGHAKATFMSDGRTVEEAIINAGGSASGSTTGGSKEWKCVVDRRMEVGEQNVEFTTFADGTPLQAEEAVVQVIVDGVAASLTGYVAINSTTNKTDSLYGVIYYNATQVTGEGVTFVNHIEFKASPFVMIPKLTSGKVTVAVGGGFTGPAGSVATPQVYEDIVAIKLRPNAKITAAPPIIKIYAR